MKFWGVEVKSGETIKCKPGEGKLLHLSQAALGKTKDKRNVLIYVKLDDQKLVLGTLSVEKCAQITYDLVFEKEFELSHSSKNASVYFCGYKSDLAEDSPGYDDISDKESDEVAEIAHNVNDKESDEVAEIAHNVNDKESDEVAEIAHNVNAPCTLWLADKESDEVAEIAHNVNELPRIKWTYGRRRFTDKHKVTALGEKEKSNVAEESNAAAEAKARTGVPVLAEQKAADEDDEDDDSEDEDFDPDMTEDQGDSDDDEYDEDDESSEEEEDATPNKAKVATPGGKNEIGGDGKKSEHFASPYPAKQAGEKVLFELIWEPNGVGTRCAVTAEDFLT